MAGIKDCRLLMKAAEMEDHERWLALRRQGIGGSEAGVIVGVNPWKSPYALWLEKTGQAESEDVSGKEAVYWGTQLEDMVAHEFAKRTGKKVQRHGMLQSIEYPFLLANVDRLVVGEEAGLECKTASAYKVDEWAEDNLPDSYYIQCQHYMLVTGLPKWYIAVLIGGQKFIWKCIERNDDDIEAMFAAERAFWDCVKANTPPPADGSLSCSRALNERFPGGDLEPVCLPRDFGAEVDHIHMLTDTEARIEEEIRECQNRIKAAMGDHETAVYGTEEHGGRITWKWSKPRISIDTKRLKAEKPEIFDAYKKTGNPYRVLRFHAN